MYKIKHWMLISRSSLLLELLASRWSQEFLVTLSGWCPEDKDYVFDQSKLSFVIIDLATITPQEAYELQLKVLHSQSIIRVIFIHFPYQSTPDFLIQRAITAGIFYLDTPLEKIGAGLQEIVAGRTLIPLDFIATNKTKKATSKLTEALTIREREVLNSLCSGLSNFDIAEQLFVSESTVKTHLYNAFKKIGVSSRAEAIAWAQSQDF